MPGIDGEIIKKLIDASPAYGAILLILIGAGVIILRMQGAMNKFFCKTQKRDEQREKRMIDIVSENAAASQRNADAVQELTSVIREMKEHLHAASRGVTNRDGDVDEG